jgi:hypothetical protein
VGKDKVSIYRETLRELTDWIPYLIKESGLPGPRGNLELAQAVAEEGDELRFKHLRSYDPEKAPTNTPGEFLAFCGVLGLGKLMREGKTDELKTLRSFNNDPRWRVREAVAIALQIYGEANMDALLREMVSWVNGSYLERRAVVAALCEPKLLRDGKVASQVLRILDDVTRSVEASLERGSADFRVLRQGLGYCWSVAVAAAPKEGVKILERWFTNTDPDIRWIMRENLKKKRLERLDPEWADTWLKNLT